jgi:hypothetical protein
MDSNEFIKELESGLEEKATEIDDLATPTELFSAVLASVSQAVKAAKPKPRPPRPVRPKLTDAQQRRVIARKQMLRDRRRG